MAVEFWKLEDAFVRKFTGKKLKDRNERVNVVPVFVDYPDIEEVKERRFPSISVMFNGMSPDTDLYDSDTNRTVEVDFSTDPPTFRTRRMSEFYNISYQVKTLHEENSADTHLVWVKSHQKE